MDEPINFSYEDTDTLQNEISELYSYGEESEFFANRNAFEESMEDSGLPLTWKHMVPEQKSRAINYLMTTLEVSCRTTRIKSCRALAYLTQGIFGECLSLEEQAINSRENVFLLYEQGLFQAFVQQLLIEANMVPPEANQQQQQQQQQQSSSSNQIFNDSSELRLILAVLCTITETMYHVKDSTDTKLLEMRQQFIAELQNPIGDELLTITLFRMLNNFCGGLAPHYPVRKITLLLWKVILITLGGVQTLKQSKDAGRKISNLQPLPDDTMEVTKNMRPCSPPMMSARATKAVCMVLSNNNKAADKRKVLKQTAFDDVFAFALAEFERETKKEPNDENESENENEKFDSELNDSTEIRPGDFQSETEVDQYMKEKIEELSPQTQKPDIYETLSESESNTDTESTSSDPISTDLSGSYTTHEICADRVRPFIEDFDETDESAPAQQQPPTSSLKLTGGTPQDGKLDGSRSDITSTYKGLPWAPKVRKVDLSQHMSNIRQKFLGYSLPNDLETTFGLPDPIIEGINVLKKHLYVSLSEKQLEREEMIEKYPLTHKDLNPNYRDLPAEKLYSALLPKLPQYMIALLKILLAASTNSKNKSERGESINIMSETSIDNDSASIIQTMKMSVDASRHKEIIIKAVSAILLLLLKHFKLNHIYQFEYVSQQLMFANCIPLILKFLSQDIDSYIMSSKSTISAIDFPACVIGEQPELTTEAIELCSFQPYSWRNMFSCINLVRILNKLTKWKHSRIMMLVVFKSAPTLTKALCVRHSMFQLYVLKLLKVQLKFLGRQWKKSNMKLISAIYQKVRHRLTDDWAYSNDNEARPWDFQAEEFTLQANINKFHQRRYHEILTPEGGKNRNSIVFIPTDKFGGTYDGCTDEDYEFGSNNEIIQISPQFEKNYSRWLESEVFQRNIEWDRLLKDHL